MPANDSGPVVALSWEPLSTETIWHGPAATARGKLEQGTYFAANHIVGVTGQGVLVTDENTGQSTYFLATADEVQQHPADISYQVLSAVPDAYQWTAPSIHDAMAYQDEVVIGVRTIDGSHHTFEIGAAGTASIRAIRAVQGNRPVELPDPVHIDDALRDHVAFLVEVGALPSGAQNAPAATTASRPPAAFWRTSDTSSSTRTTSTPRGTARATPALAATPSNASPTALDKTGTGRSSSSTDSAANSKPCTTPATSRVPLPTNTPTP